LCGWNSAVCVGGTVQFVWVEQCSLCEWNSAVCVGGTVQFVWLEQCSLCGWNSAACVSGTVQFVWVEQCSLCGWNSAVCVAGTVLLHVPKCAANVGATLSAAGLWNLDIRHVIVRVWRCLERQGEMVGAKVERERGDKNVNITTATWHQKKEENKSKTWKEMRGIWTAKNIRLKTDGWYTKKRKSENYTWGTERNKSFKERKMTDAVGKFRSSLRTEYIARDVDDEWGQMKKSKLGVMNITAGKEM